MSRVRGWNGVEKKVTRKVGRKSGEFSVVPKRPQDKSVSRRRERVVSWVVERY